MRLKRVCGVGICLGALVGCSQGPALEAGLVRTAENTGPAVELAARSVPPNTVYQVGINTIWSPEFVGSVQSDPSGNVAPRVFGFSCDYIMSPPIFVGLFLNGLPVAQTALFAMPCAF
jgi:hypothetical protein